MNLVRGAWISDIGGVDLDAAVLLRKRGGAITRVALDPATVADFARRLATAHALGDRAVRMDQFCDGAWVFTIRLDGVVVHQSFEGETGRVDPVLQPILDLVWRG